MRRGQVDASRKITTLAVASRHGMADTSTAIAAVGRADGSVECMDPITGCITWTVPGSDPMDVVESVHVHFRSTDALSSATGLDAPPPARIVSLTKSGTARYHTTNIDGTASLDSSWKVPATVCCSALDQSTERLAVGSLGAELRVYDLQAPSHAVPFYSAKGGKPNKVGLVDKPWNSAIAFLPGSHGTRVVVGTGHHKLRLYDVTVGKRPQMDVSFGEARITALAPEPDGQRC